MSPAYHVWLSEIMLQQTVVKTVIPYFQDFTARWPEVCDLAAAPLDEVMAAWAGLGYYARARNLHRAAAVICNEHGGAFPHEQAGLAALPGVGPYTAGAIAAIAFGREAVVVDANIERVLARYFAIADPPAKSKRVFADAYREIRAPARPSDFPQALMDLASAVCGVKSPQCAQCPLSGGCAARATGTPLAWPVKEERKPKPHRRGMAFVALDADGLAYMVTRPARGLLGGMLAFPSAGWTEADAPLDPGRPFASAPFDADWRVAGDAVAHVFTHFALTMDVAVARVGGEHGGHGEPGGGWREPRPDELPTLMRKVWRAVQTVRFE